MSVPDATGARLAPSETRPQDLGCPADSGRQNALERAAADARKRLVQRTETQARVVIHLHETAERARSLLDPESDRETQALKREWEEREYARKYDARALREAGSSHAPRAQCGGCKKFLGPAEWQCTNCGYAGDAGYLPVPPKTSIYERWR